MERTLIEPQKRTGLFSYVSLFTSFSTLLCCALPSLFVLFGLGATVASALSAAPWLVTLSHHKNWVFIVAGFLIGGNFVLWLSGALYLVGCFSVYILGPLLVRFDS